MVCFSQNELARIKAYDRKAYAYLKSFERDHSFCYHPSIQRIRKQYWGDRLCYIRINEASKQYGLCARWLNTQLYTPCERLRFCMCDDDGIHVKFTAPFLRCTKTFDL